MTEDVVVAVLAVALVLAALLAGREVRRRGRADAAAGAARERERVLRVAVEELDDGLVATDPSGRTLAASAAAAALLEPLAPVERAVVDDLLARALLGVQSARELGTAPADGDGRHLAPRPVAARFACLRDGGRIVGAAAYLRDLSPVRRVDDMRRDFVANVSHELRTPIGGLSVLAEALAGEDDPARARDLASRLLEETDRLGRVVEDLLDLSALEGPGALHPEAVAVPGLVEAAVDRVRGAATASGVHLAIRQPVPDVAVVCDRRRVVSAVANLLDNGVKYSGEGGSVELAVDADAAELAFTVTDDGIGIERADQERVFERFYRVDAARSRQTGGSGLGLAVVRHVATTHGGRVSVESTPGVGSTFRLVLPLGGAPGPTRRAAASGPGEGADRR